MLYVLSTVSTKGANAPIDLENMVTKANVKYEPTIRGG